jgi:FlaA1/EpsC-like NDP-sugar epimerase
MTAGFALFLMDALAVAVMWPLTVRLTGAPIGFLQLLLFALLNLGFLYALGLYRRDIISEPDKAIRRIPLITALSVAASSLASAVLHWNISIMLCIAAVACFSLGAMVARAVFTALRRHSLFRSRLLVIGAGRRAWDLLQVLRNQGRHLQYDMTFVHEDRHCLQQFAPACGACAGGPDCGRPR